MSKVVEMEKWVSEAEFRDMLGGVSKRWLYYRIKDGMPADLIAGRTKVLPSKAIAWLRQHGFIERAS